MKSLEELYEEARKDSELISAFTEAVEKRQLEGFLKEQSCEASLEEAQTFLAAQMGKTQTLSDEELDNVAGGKYDDCELCCPKCRKFAVYHTKTHVGWKHCPYCGHDFYLY